MSLLLLLHPQPFNPSRPTMRPRILPHPDRPDQIGQLDLDALIVALLLT